jgi:dTDP-glucose pyrophosphorylase
MLKKYKMTKNIKNTITHNTPIRNAIKTMDINKLDMLIVLNKRKKVEGVFTLGDFQRAIFLGLDIDDNISLIINKKFEYLIEGFSNDDARKIFLNNELILEIPVLKKNLSLSKTIYKSDFLSSKELKKNNTNFKNVPVVIMAGGKGTRLDPFTRILPKPLIPFGNNPIVRIIMDYFKKFGSNKFYISVNDKSGMIKAYFNDLKKLYNIKFIDEKKPLGTAGSLKLLKNSLKKTFFVTNCDVLIQSHYPAILKFHKKNKYDLTLVSSLRDYTIPYGVCNFNKNGELLSIKEKPKYDFFINTGLYLVEPKILKLIPSNLKFDMNELLNRAREKNLRIGVFPVSENSWLDIGQWSEYKKNVDLFNF